MYVNRKPGVEVISGKITDIIADHSMVKIAYSEYDRSAKALKDSSKIVELPGVDISTLQVGEDVTLVTGMNQAFCLKDGQTATLKTGSYTAKDGTEHDTGMTVIRGQLTFAAYKDEKGNVTKAGTPKKEHYDLLVNAGGKTHDIHIYNSGKMTNAIQNAQRKYDKIDLANNRAVGTFITGLSTGNYETNKNGSKTLHETYFGITNPINDDLTLMPKEKVQEKSTNVQETKSNDESFTDIPMDDMLEIEDVFN